MNPEILSVLLSVDARSVAEVATLLPLSTATGRAVRAVQRGLSPQGHWLCTLVPRMCR